MNEHPAKVTSPAAQPIFAAPPEPRSVEDLRALRVVRVMEPGKSGACELLQGGIVRKSYSNRVDVRMAREVRALRNLAPYDHFPTLLFEDHQESSIYMTYVGENVRFITADRIPPDYEEQLDAIVYALQEADVFHPDLHLYHVMLQAGRLYVIDFDKAVSHADTSFIRRRRYADVTYLKDVVSGHFSAILSRASPTAQCDGPRV